MRMVQFCSLYPKLQHSQTAILVNPKDAFVYRHCSYPELFQAQVLCDCIVNSFMFDWSILKNSGLLVLTTPTPTWLFVQTAMLCPSLLILCKLCSLMLFIDVICTAVLRPSCLILPFSILFTLYMLPDSMTLLAATTKTVKDNYWLWLNFEQPRIEQPKYFFLVGIHRLPKQWHIKGG